MFLWLYPQVKVINLGGFFGRFLTYPLSVSCIIWCIYLQEINRGEFLAVPRLSDSILDSITSEILENCTTVSKSGQWRTEKYESKISGFIEQTPSRHLVVLQYYSQYLTFRAKPILFSNTLHFHLLPRHSIRNTGVSSRYYDITTSRPHFRGIFVSGVPCDKLRNECSRSVLRHLALDEDGFDTIFCLWSLEMY